MSGLFGGGSRGAIDDIRDGIHLGTSAYGRPLPIVYGKNRVDGNIFWMPRESWRKVTGQPAGKGGADAGTPDAYYQAVAIGICEGPVTLGRIWRDKIIANSISDSRLYDGGDGFTFFNGARTQAAWTYPALPAAGVEVQATLPNSGPYTYRITDPGYSGLQWVKVAHIVNVDVGYQWDKLQVAFVGSPSPTVVVSDGDPTSPTLTFHSSYANKSVRIGYQVGNQTLGGYAIPYGGTAYLINARLGLGSSNAMKNFSYEIQGFGTADANGNVNPADIISDFLTNTDYGAGLSSSLLEVVNGQDGLAASGYKRYCDQMGFMLSPVFAEQKSALEHVRWLLDASNAEMMESGGKLKIVPLGDQTVGTFAPYVTPVYALNEDNFVRSGPDEDPIACECTSLADVYNSCPVEFLDSQTNDASSAYNVSVVEHFEQADVQLTGGQPRKASPLSLHCITRASIAQVISRIQAQRSVYARTRYRFKLGFQFQLLEPLDLVTLSESVMGLSNRLVRITSIEEDDTGTFHVEAVECPLGVAHAAAYTTQTGQGGGQDFTADPLSAAPPVIVVPPLAATANGKTPELWLATNGLAKDWAGAQVWTSYDGSTYTYAGDAGRATYGILNSTLAQGSPIDWSSTLQVNLGVSGGTLSSVTAADRDALATECWADGEIVAFQTASLVSGNTYNLTGLRRGLLGTGSVSHSALTEFVRIDSNVVRIPIDPARYGSTIYIKLVSFNLSRSNVQDIATLYPFAYTLPSAYSALPVLDTLPVKITFDKFDLRDWTTPYSNGVASIVSGGLNGDKMLQVTGGRLMLVWNYLIPYDPLRLYRLMARYKQSVAPTTQNGIYFKMIGVAADGVTLVQSDGAAGYLGVNNFVVTPADLSFHETSGFWKGTHNPGGSSGTASAPGTMHTNVRYVRLAMDFTDSADGVAQIDSLVFDQQLDLDGTGIVPGTITVDRLAANCLQTSNYAESGGYPTAGVKLDATGTALKVAPGNLLLGHTYLDQTYFSKMFISRGDIQSNSGTLSGGMTSGTLSYYSSGNGTIRVTFTFPSGITSISDAFCMSEIYNNRQLQVSAVGSNYVELQCFDSTGAAVNLNSVFVSLRCVIITDSGSGYAL